MRACFALLALVALVSTANAAKLVVTATNLNGVPSTSSNGNIAGTKVFTISLMFEAGDINPPAGSALLAGTFSIEGSTTLGPRQNTGTGVNQQMRQGVQDRIDVGTDVGNVETLRNDSWWYASSDGNLVSNSEDPDTGDPIVTPLGPVWTPFSFGGGITGGLTQGARMDAVMTYGPFPFPVQPSTIPLVQVRTGEDLLLGGEILVGVTGFDMCGLPSTGTPANNPKYVLDFETMQIICPEVPEPSTFVLAGMGLIGLTLAWRRRK